MNAAHDRRRRPATSAWVGIVAMVLAPVALAVLAAMVIAGPSGSSTHAQVAPGITTPAGDYTGFCQQMAPVVQAAKASPDLTALRIDMPVSRLEAALAQIDIAAVDPSLAPDGARPYLLRVRNGLADLRDQMRGLPGDATLGALRIDPAFADAFTVVTSIYQEECADR